jgi:hypothetical protein
MQAIERLYFIEFEDVNNRDILSDIYEYAISNGLKARTNMKKQRILITQPNTIYANGIQIIIYNDVLKIYKNIDKTPIHRYHYTNIKKICKEFPPTRKVMSMTFCNVRQQDVDTFAQFDLWLRDYFSLWLKKTVYERRINVH